MSQKKVLNALVFVAALLFGAILFQSARRNSAHEERRSSSTARDYRPQLSPDVFDRVLDENAISPARKKPTTAPARTESEQNSQEARQLTASR